VSWSSRRRAGGEKVRGNFGGKAYGVSTRPARALVARRSSPISGDADLGTSPSSTWARRARRRQLRRPPYNWSRTAVSACLFAPRQLFRPRLSCSLCIAAGSFGEVATNARRLGLLHPQISALCCLHLALAHPPKRLPEIASPRCLREHICPGSPSPPPPPPTSPARSTATAAHHGLEFTADGCHHHRALQDTHKQRPQENSQRGGHLADGQQGCTTSARHWP
jgi:hypothetical protein